MNEIIFMIVFEIIIDLKTYDTQFPLGYCITPARMHFIDIDVRTSFLYNLQLAGENLMIKREQNIKSLEIHC